MSIAFELQQGSPCVSPNLPDLLYTRLSNSQTLAALDKP